MGRGVSSGGGQSSLGYLFGSDAPPPTKPVEKPEPTPQVMVAPKVAQPPPVAAVAQTEGQANRNTNNYHRADGQNTGNFITDRPSTKVHSAPGGGSSLGYLFGGQK